MGRGLLIGGVLLSAGCTFLITFDDKPGKDAGTAPTTFPPPPPPPLPPPFTPPPPPPPPPTDPCDRSLDLAKVNGCAAFTVANAQACADNSSFDPYPFTTTVNRDVVTCNDSKAVCVQHCKTACAHLPNGFPDECDQCAGKPDGDYCGTEMGWSAKNYSLLIHCASGRLSDTIKPVNCSVSCVPANNTGSAHCGT